MNKIACLFVTICFLVGFAGSVSASTITFGDGYPVRPDGYTEAGMVLSGNAFGIRNWQASPEIGEREMLFTGTTSFSLVSGLEFDLVSLDIEDPAGTGRNYSKEGSALVTGSNGATATLASTSFGTQPLPGFQNITWFTLGCLATDCQVTVDNIEFTDPSVSTVPIPASLPLLLAGLGGLAIVRRRSRA